MTLARNTLFNLLGQIVPLGLALVSIPMTITEYGVERFGVLSLAWVVLGYFGLFDLGLGRALTRLVAEKKARRAEDEIPSLVWTALVLMTVLGCVGALVGALASIFVAGEVLKVPSDMVAEARTIFVMLSLSLPVVIVTTGLRGVLEGHQRFDLTNILRLPLGLLTYASPLLALPLGRTLVPIIWILVVGRIIAAAGYLVACLKVVPGMAGTKTFDFRQAAPLLSFGGWMTASNILSPIMAYLDRFLIGSVLSMSAVAYYVTPFEVVTKLWILPAAAVGVLFPIFTGAYVIEVERASNLFQKSVWVVFWGLLPLVLLSVAFAERALELWLGAEFAAQAARVLQVLAVGVLANSLAQVAFALVQGAGRADVTAKLHMIEVLPYLALVGLLTPRFGILGCATAWTIRAIADGVCLFFAARGLLGSSLRFLLGLGGAFVLALGVMLVSVLLSGPLAVGWVVIIGAGCLAMGYRLLAPLMLNGQTASVLRSS